MTIDRGEHFKAVAGPRVIQICALLDKLQNCADPKKYRSTLAQQEKMFQALEERIARLRHVFQHRGQPPDFFDRLERQPGSAEHD